MARPPKKAGQEHISGLIPFEITPDDIGGEGYLVSQFSSSDAGSHYGALSFDQSKASS